MKNSKKRQINKLVKPNKYSHAQLLDKAEELIGAGDYELAETFCARCLEGCTNDVVAHDRCLTLLAILNVEQDKVEKALEYLTNAIHLYPNEPPEKRTENYTKYLYFGQLSVGIDAANAYSAAIAIIEFLLERIRVNVLPKQNSLPGANNQSDVTVDDLTSTCCALAELYMTDLCEEENAEKLCLEVLQKALTAAPDNPEVNQTYASFLISAQRRDDAIIAIKHSLDSWLPPLKKVIDDAMKLQEDANGDVQFDEENDEPDTSDSQNAKPVEMECPLSFDSRVSCCRLLIELELFELCEDVLNVLLAENDSCFDVWYLFGWQLYLRKERLNEATAYLEQAKTLASEDDVEVVGHIDEILAELGENSDTVTVETAMDAD